MSLRDDSARFEPVGFGYYRHPNGGLSSHPPSGAHEGYELVVVTSEGVSIRPVDGGV